MSKVLQWGFAAVLFVTLILGGYYYQAQRVSLTHNQDEIHQYLSELEQFDTQLDRQLLLLDSWNFRNYDGLNAAYTQMLTALDQPPRLPQELMLAIEPIKEILEQKYELIEALKSNSALLRNSVNYLPQISKLLYVNIERAVRNQEITSAKGSELKHFLEQEMLHALTYQLVYTPLGSGRNLVDVSRLSQPFQRDWFNAMKHLSFFLNYRKTSIQFNEELAHSGMQEKLAQLNMMFSRYLEELDRRIERQQLWLFFYITVALSLIALLATALRHYRSKHIKRKEQALTDPLTGLGNRRMLEQHLPLIRARAIQHKETVGVLFIDLDGFKAINDTLGHQQGDLLLQYVAKNLTHSLRQGDLVVRFGGDEFVLVIAGATKEILGRIANNTLKLCRVSFEDQVSNLTVSASIGVSAFPTDTRDMQELLTMADSAMYRAKEQGKDCFEFYQ